MACLRTSVGCAIPYRLEYLLSAAPMSLYQHSPFFGGLLALHSTTDRNDPNFFVLVRTLTGTEYKVAAKSVEDVKVFLEANEGIPYGQQRLVYAGRQLSGYDLVDYSMGAGASSLAPEAPWWLFPGRTTRGSPGPRRSDRL